MVVIGYKEMDVLVSGTEGVVVSTASVSDPPTSAELTSEFGTPAEAGAGAVRLLNNGGADTHVYLVASTGATWRCLEMPEAG
jgi:hypothetical protein